MTARTLRNVFLRAAEGSPTGLEHVVVYSDGHVETLPLSPSGRSEILRCVADSRWESKT